MKRNMTRPIALLAAMVLLFSLAACKDGKEKTDPSIGPAVVSNDSSETLDAAKPEEGSDTATGEGGSQASENPPDHANTQPGGQDTPTTPGGQQATQSGGQAPPASGIKATTDKAYVLQLYKDCLAVRRML